MCADHGPGNDDKATGAGPERDEEAVQERDDRTTGADPGRERGVDQERDGEVAPGTDEGVVQEKGEGVAQERDGIVIVVDPGIGTGAGLGIDTGAGPEIDTGAGPERTGRTGGADQEREENLTRMDVREVALVKTRRGEVVQETGQRRRDHVIREADHVTERGVDHGKRGVGLAIAREAVQDHWRGMMVTW